MTTGCNSVHVIFDETCDEDTAIVTNLCRDIRDCGIDCTNCDVDVTAGGLEMQQRVSLISSATWVIVVCSQIKAFDENNIFSFEENMALFEAVMKGLQNVVYLLVSESNITPLVAKGFSFFKITGKRAWVGELTELIQTRPVNFCERMFHHFCCQLAMLKQGMFDSMAVFVSVSSFQQDKLTCILQGSQGPSEYVFDYCNDSVKLVSSPNCGSNSGVTFTDSPRGVCPEGNDTNVDVMSDERTPLLRHPESINSGTDSVALDQVNKVDIKVKSTRFSKVIGSICVLLWLVAMLFFSAMGVLNAFVLSNNNDNFTFGVSSHPPMNVAFWSVCAALSLFTVFCSLRANTHNLTKFTIYLTFLSVASIVFHLTYLDKLTPREIASLYYGLLTTSLLINLCILSDYFYQRKHHRLCVRLSSHAFYVFMIIAETYFTFELCILSPLVFKLANLSFKNALIFMIILFIYQIGFLQSIMNKIKIKVSSKIKPLYMTIVEVSIFCVFLAVWFVPSFIIFPDTEIHCLNITTLTPAQNITDSPIIN